MAENCSFLSLGFREGQDGKGAEMLLWNWKMFLSFAMFSGLIEATLMPTPPSLVLLNPANNPLVNTTSAIIFQNTNNVSES